MTETRQVGDRIPRVTFKLRRDGAWLERHSDEIFRGRRVVLFALPAAFSPTCSARHLAGFVALSKNIRAMGIDDICCLSVNDAFVMNAWARDQGIDDEVILLPDGNGDFTRQMGMLISRRDQGFGERSRRYAMLVEDGVIRALFAEDHAAGGDPLAVSDAITLLDHLDRQARQAAAE